MRIGLIADTHIPAVGRDLPFKMYETFKGVDLILHAGDIVIPRVLDMLSEIAPTKAVRGNEDHYLVEDPRMQPPQVLTLEGIRIGLTHYPVYEYRTSLVFGEPVDVVVYGHTHEPGSEIVDGILFVNPGSATNPYNQVRPGTVGILEIRDGEIDFQIIQL